MSLSSNSFKAFEPDKSLIERLGSTVSQSDLEFIIKIHAKSKRQHRLQNQSSLNVTGFIFILNDIVNISMKDLQLKESG